jgi:two-component system, OmpR family, sensor kinase
MFKRLSLRARLVLGVIVLAALGLGAADVATYTSLRSFLIDRTNSTLDSLQHAFGQPGFAGSGPGQPPVYIQLRAANGTTILAQQSSPTFDADGERSPPKLPATISLRGAVQRGPDLVRYFDVPTVSGDDRYRVRVSHEPGKAGMLVVAMSLNDVDDTLHRLVVVEGAVTAAVLAALTLLALWLVRDALRPLRAIERTAGAIADGDLTQRVERADNRTEVGRLGVALNAMLGQIESAFRAREASEQKLRRFVADASHELRTPLAAVRAYAELFTRGADRRPDDLARSMAGIERESERMSLLVDDLLLLAHLDEGRPFEREEVQLDDVVREAVDSARAVEPERQITLDVEPLVVLGDHDRLRQIVDNLLANVRAHTPDASPVHVALARTNGSARIEVADSGPGLSDDDLARVFERFYRADDSRSRSTGGVGLGLSIVAAVVAAHGGEVDARSAPDGGAVFRITLPLAKPS